MSPALSQTQSDPRLISTANGHAADANGLLAEPNDLVTEPNGLLLSVTQALYEPVQAEMAEVEAILRTELRSQYPAVDRLVRYGCLLGGKRLRPALMLLVARSLGQVTPEHLTLAAVVEMIHTATLVHDDVLDEADMRRHLATVNARWGNEQSVLLGDFLFTHAFYLSSTLESTFACRTIGRATNIVCEGEMRQVDSRGNLSLTEAEYLSIISGKTAELCACACRLGAHFTGVDDAAVESMARYGLNLGIAFQIADDLLDVLGDERATGKSLGTDLEKQKATLPLIRLLSLASSEELDQIAEIVQGEPLPSAESDRRQQLRHWLDRYGAIEYARDAARKYADLAKAEIEKLPESPAQQVLLALPEFVVARSC